MQRTLYALPLWLALVLIPLASWGQQTPTRVALVAFSAMPPGATAPNIYIVPANGTYTIRLLIPNASWPAISADGSKLAFVRGQDLYVANYDGTAIRAITHHATTVQVAHPAFNAAGNGLVFALGTPNAPFAIAMINLDGSGETTVASNGLDPIFTPEGANIVFANANTIDLMPLPSIGQQGLQPSPIVTAVPTAVLRFPAFSVRTAFSAYTSTPTQGAIPSIRLVSYAGGQRQDTIWETDATQPAFSADGLRIAFMRQGDIYMKPVTGGAVTRLTSGGMNSEPAWFK
jgi:Tol biopolymer transport system component